MNTPAIKVYLVIGHVDHEGDIVVAVMPTQELAAEVKKAAPSLYDDVRVEEWTVGEVPA